MNKHSIYEISPIIIPTVPMNDNVMTTHNSGTPPAIITYPVAFPFAGNMNLYIRPASPVTMTKPIPIHYYIPPFRALPMFLHHPKSLYYGFPLLRVNLVPKNESPIVSHSIIPLPELSY